METERPRGAREDSLTGLPNREASYEELRRAVQRAAERGERLAVFLLDLDRFKDTNDTMGHSAGDALLVSVARRLKAGIEPGCMLGRLGGDEFVILVERAGDTEALESQAARIVAVFGEPFPLDGHTVDVTASVGVAVFPSDGLEVEDLLRRAEIAMYKAKEGQGPRERFQFFHAESDRAMTERVRLIRELRAALRDDSLDMAYQPQVDLETGEIKAAEALLRWRHPELGDVKPSRVVQVAETAGLIHDLGGWVLDRVCRQIRVWTDQNLRPVPVAVNLSAMQLGEQKAAVEVLSRLERHGVEPNGLMVEITESALIDPSRGARAALAELDAAGIAIVLDDFGTGFSSLTYLRQFPVSCIKVDSSFVRGVGTSAHDEEIITAMLGLARGLGIKVVAEGVETPEQAEFLRTRGCGAAQGYLFGKPMPAAEFSRLLEGARAQGA